MNFENYLNQAWSDHAKEPQMVANGFSKGLELAETNEHLSQLSGLVTHVMGEHLGQWNEGIQLLSNLQTHRSFLKDSETQHAIQRSVATLQLAGEQAIDLTAFPRSDQIRILATTASAVSERNAPLAKGFFSKALKLAEQGLEQKDPANRALAITGNNLASALEAKPARSSDETALMVNAAQAARKYWEIAGTWLQVERAEYRLAMTYLQANDLVAAYKHANTCLEICQTNKAGELDLFFAYEAVALVEKARDNKPAFQAAVEKAKDLFQKLNDEDRPWCEDSLQKLIK